MEECVTEAFQVLMIDPPWQKQKAGYRKARPRQGKVFDYKTMPTQQIFQLLDSLIFAEAADNHCVFMWAIDQYLVDCEKYMQDRGYKRHCRFVWDKLNGIAPAFTVRYCHEYMIWFYKKRLLPVATDTRGRFSTVITERGRQHSRKPDGAYHIIELFYPHAKKWDVFSREKRGGWIQFGDEPAYFQN